MLLAAYVPVVQLLASRNIHIIVVSTMRSDYSKSFGSSLGFELPGAVVMDRKRKSHKACGLKSSVYASLVQPFKKHLATFGSAALCEALRVSLVNATPGHGSSWQQGALIILQHPGLGTSASSVSGVSCAYAWREDYPGDWQPVRAVLQEAFGISDPPHIDFPERLDFVIACRNQHRSAKVRDGSEVTTTTSKRGAEAALDDGCGGEACSIDAVRKRSQEAMSGSR